MRRKLALILLALLVVGLASPVLALQTIHCPRCQGEETWAAYECPSCHECFTVEPAQSWNGDVPPSLWECPYCHLDSVPPVCAGCDNCGAFWP